MAPGPVRSWAQRNEDSCTPEEATGEGEVRDLLSELTPERQEICRALMRGESVAQIARSHGRCWYTIQRQIAGIRRHFAERGLDPWLG